MNAAKFCHKFCVGFLSLLHLLVGIALLASGSYVLWSFHNIVEFAKATNIMVPASIMLAVGILLFFLGLLGCAAFFKKSKMVVTTFLILSSILLVIEVAGAGTALALRGKLEGIVRDDFEKLMDQYNKTTIETKEVHWIQSNFQCCGFHNATDWIIPSNGSASGVVPDSCCYFDLRLVGDNCTSSVVLQHNVPGCVDKLQHYIYDEMVIIGAVGLSFFVVQLIALLTGACTYRYNQQSSYYEQFY